MCELPRRCALPLSRWSLADIQREVMAEGIVAEISGSTLWRWLSREALCPWRYRSWIFPRDPNFAVKAGRLLDLYQGRWEGPPLGRRDFVLSADEKTSIQARIRIDPSLPPASGPLHPHRARVPTRRCLRLHWRLECPSRQALRPLREHHRHPTI